MGQYKNYPIHYLYDKKPICGIKSKKLTININNVTCELCIAKLKEMKLWND